MQRETTTARHDGTDDEPAGLLLVCLLAALAGAVDAAGLTVLKDLFVSFMSGNTTSLGVALARGDWQRVAFIAEILIAFIAGAAAGAVLRHLAGRRHLPVVVVATAAVLAIPPFAPAVVPIALPFAMGMLNAAMQQAGQVAVSVTYVTGTLVKFGQGLGRLLCGQAHDSAWVTQTVPWLGLLAGALATGLAEQYHGAIVFLALPIAAALIAGLSALAVAWDH